MAWQTRFDDFSVSNNPSHKFDSRQSMNDKRSRQTIESKASYAFKSISQNAGQNVNSSVESFSPTLQHNSIHSPTNDYGSQDTQLASSMFTRISEISSSSSTIRLVALLIAKEGQRSFLSKKGTFTERHLISFTVRDDLNAFINLTCWGGQEFITMLADTFQVGQIVEIKGAQVQTKSKNPSDEKFKPWTPSQFCLNLSENQGEIDFYHGTDVDNFSRLLNMPIRENSDFYTLDDIQANGKNLQSEHINLFALVKRVWPTKEIITKVGKKSLKSDVVLCDETCSEFQLTLWDEATKLTTNWKPLQTVLFAADVKINFSDYKSAMVASADSKTVFISDPDTREAYLLRDFGATLLGPGGDAQPNFQGTQGSLSDPDISSITNIVHVEDLMSMQDELIDVNGGTAYGVLNAFLTCFDIDSESKLPVRNVCVKCHRIVEETNEYKCQTPDCSCHQLPLESRVKLEYCIALSLTDTTGSLEAIFAPHDAVQDFLNISPSDFLSLDIQTRTQLKWQFLFEMMRVVMKVTALGFGKKSSFKILAFKRAVESNIQQK